MFQVRLPTKRVAAFSDSSVLVFLASVSSPASCSALRFLEGASSDFSSGVDSESESDPSESFSESSESSEDCEGKVRKIYFVKVGRD